MHILVADDHPINAKYLCILLEKMGHTADSCDNGAQALRCVQTQSYDVVLMDLHMPVMDGISATRAIRQLKYPAANTKIIMVSADILNDTRQNALEAGIDGFITKPVLEDGLRRALALLNGAALLPSEAIPLPTPLPTAISSEATATPLVHAQTYRDFVDLMPPETVEKQLRALFDPESNDLQALTTALESGQRSEAGTRAHQLKGVCMLMGLTAIGHVLADIEKALAANSVSLPTVLARELTQTAQATHTAVQALR